MAERHGGRMSDGMSQGTSGVKGQWQCMSVSVYVSVSEADWECELKDWVCVLEECGSVRSAFTGRQTIPRESLVHHLIVYRVG